MRGLLGRVDVRRSVGRSSLHVDEGGEVRDVASDDVNEYLRETSGGDFTAKDFRTWAGTVLAYRALCALRRGCDARDGGSAGHTPAVTRKSYVHPAVVEAYMHGRVGGALIEAAEEQPTPPAQATPEEEAAVVDLLVQGIENDARRGTGTGPRRRRQRRRRHEKGAACRTRRR